VPGTLLAEGFRRAVLKFLVKDGALSEALIEDLGAIRRILEHLGLWALEPPERSPPLDPASWPPYANLPLTYHPVPDIA